VWEGPESMWTSKWASGVVRSSPSPRGRLRSKLRLMYNAAMETRRQVGGIEGFASGNKLSQYEKDLGFEGSLLRGQRVLNYGCGTSNLSGELRRAGITDMVVDLDLLFDPHEFDFSPLKRGVHKPSAERQQFVAIERRLADVHDRNFVQANGRFLPFVDQAFDTAFALITTYQTPPRARIRVLSELLRVSNRAHIYPVEGHEYQALRAAARLTGHEIIHSSYPEERDILIRKPEDYGEYKKKPKRERIEVPVPDLTEIHFENGEPVASEPPRGTLVILQRKGLRTAPREESVTP
jgi:SAM-dependent methyltransferase